MTILANPQTPADYRALGYEVRVSPAGRIAYRVPFQRALAEGLTPHWQDGGDVPDRQETPMHPHEAILLLAAGALGAVMCVTWVML